MMSRRNMATKCVVLEIEKDQDSETSTIRTVEEKELPALGASGVLIQIRACGLNSVSVEKERSDLLKGACTLNTTETGAVQLCLGQDVAGIVRGIGCDVSTLQIGDRVVGVIPLDYNQSGCASYVLLQEFDVALIPNGISFIEAAACIGDAVKSYTALHYLGRLVSDDTVMILGGASSLGSLCIQLARHWGARVIATVGSNPEERQYLNSIDLDASQIIEFGSGLRSSVMLETGNLGADIILDLQINRNEKWPSTHEIISCLSVGGRWITTRADLQLDPPNSRQLLLRCSSIGFLFEQAWMLSSAQQGRYQHILMDVMEKVSTKTILPHISHTVTNFDEVPEALKELEASINLGKVVLSLP